MKARIKKDELVNFKSFAKDIIKDKNLPITGFVKIEVKGDWVKLTKTNCVSFIESTFINDSEDCQFLIDEITLFNFIELSDSDFINFNINGYKITISDERNSTVAQTENHTMFPKVDLSEAVKKWVDIPDSVMSCAGICASLLFDDEIPGLRNSVFVGDRTVAGSDGNVGYWQKFDFDLPQLVLRKNVASFVSKLKECKISSNESYDLFKSGNNLFGFSRSEIPYNNIAPVFGEPNSDLSFYLYKNSFVKWNTYCINTSKNKVLSATFSADGGKLNLKLTDEGYDKTYDSFIDISNGSGNFRFNPQTLNNLLRVLPAENIYFYPGQQRYYITDINKSFMSAIMLIK